MSQVPKGSIELKKATTMNLPTSSSGGDEMENIATLDALFSKGTRRGKDEVKKLAITHNGETSTFLFDCFGRYMRDAKNWKSGGLTLEELRVHTQRGVMKFALEC